MGKSKFAGQVGGGTVDSVARSKLNEVESDLAQKPTKGIDYAVNVKDFGAKGDGLADDTIAIQNAVNSLVNGGEVRFPVGTYKITQPIILKEYVSLVGQAYRRVVISNGAHAAFKSPNQASTFFFFGTMKNIDITSNNAVGSIGLDLYSVSYCRLEDVFVAKQAIGINYAEHCYYNYTSNVRVSECDKGFRLSGHANGNHFDDIKAINNNYGLIIDDDGLGGVPTGNHFVSLMVEQIEGYTGNATYGVCFNVSRNNTISSGRMEVHKGGGLYLGANTRDCSINDILIAVYNGGTVFTDLGSKNAVSNVFDFGLKEYVPDKVNTTLLQNSSAYFRVGQVRPTTKNKGDMWHDNAYRTLAYYNGSKTMHLSAGASAVAPSGALATTVDLTAYGGQVDQYYSVLVSAEWDTGGMWISDKTANSFVINTKNPAAGNRIFTWQIVRTV